MPASMDGSNARKIEPNRQGSKPATASSWGGSPHRLTKKVGVLPRILFFRMTPQKSAIAVLGRPSDRVEFVISHHGHRCAGLAHGARNSKNLPLLRAAIYKVTNKDHLPFWMPENTFDLGIFELV